MNFVNCFFRVFEVFSVDLLMTDNFVISPFYPSILTPFKSSDGLPKDGELLPARVLLTEFRSLVVGDSASRSAAGVSGDYRQTKNFKKFRKVCVPLTKCNRRAASEIVLLLNGERSRSCWKLVLFLLLKTLKSCSRKDVN